MSFSIPRVGIDAFIPSSRSSFIVNIDRYTVFTSCERIMQRSPPERLKLPGPLVPVFGGKEKVHVCIFVVLGLKVCHLQGPSRTIFRSPSLTSNILLRV